MRADGCKLLIKLFSNSSAFCVSFAFERDGLVWWAIHTFPRETPNKVSKLRRIGLVAGIREFLIKSLMRRFVADISNLAFQSRVSQEAQTPAR